MLYRKRSDLGTNFADVANVTKYMRQLEEKDVAGAKTGFGCPDWLRTHEPYSVRVGGTWWSYNKFGPIGDLAGLVANLVEVGVVT